MKGLTHVALSTEASPASSTASNSTDHLPLTGLAWVFWALETSFFCNSLHPCQVPLQILSCWCFPALCHWLLAFPLLAQMTGANQHTDNRSSLAHPQMVTMVTLSGLNKGLTLKVSSSVLGLPETWRMAGYKCGMQQGLKMKMYYFFNDNTCSTLPYV